MNIAFECMVNLGGVTMMVKQPLTDNSFMGSAIILYLITAVCMCLLFTGTSSFANEKSTIGEQQTSLEFNGVVIFDFDSDNDISTWRIVNDTVMGGVSSSALEGLANGGAVFTGNVSLENNGGFASIRSPRMQKPPGDHEGIAIHVKGDGKRYKIGLRTDDAFDGIFHQAPFDTLIGKWQLVKIPFKDFVPTYRGRRLSEDNRMAQEKIRSVGVLISDRQQGYFRLEIDWIGAYR
jgi:monofunctional biosynthetic peptidoglycan transglycosylase